MIKPEPNTEQKILTAAISVIEREGLQQSTIRQIAKEAGVNIAAINYYFRSKDRLIDSVFRAVTNHTIEDWLAILSNREKTPKERIRAFTEHIVGGAAAYPRMVHTILSSTYQEFMGNGYFIQRFGEVIQGVKGIFSELYPLMDDAERERLSVHLVSVVTMPSLVPELFNSVIVHELNTDAGKERFVLSVLKLFFKD